MPRGAPDSCAIAPEYTWHTTGAIQQFDRRVMREYFDQVGQLQAAVTAAQTKASG